MKKVGIDAVHYHVPQLFLSIENLAEARKIPFAKLNKGLGLTEMAVCDQDEDTATMAANAALNLIHSSELNLSEIGRIYIGTESAIDSAKPTASYVLEILESSFAKTAGKRSLMHCDVIDMTFACVGGVDAMLNCLDWIRSGQDRKAIVIACDQAKYELNSGGEYTQGAGAVAFLLTENPGLLAIQPEIGVAVESVGDFFKPRRLQSKIELFKSAAKMLGQNISDTDLEELMNSSNHSIWGHPAHNIEIHRDEPVFDGPYSNDCYTLRIQEALDHLKTQKDYNVLRDWDQLIFHLPYAFQGRRMIAPLWVDWMIQKGDLELLENQSGMSKPANDTKEWAAFVKACSKTDLYKEFVKSKIEKSERASSRIGNMYTASIFMSLVSYLRSSYENLDELTGKTIGFLSYGSGSKSKVFEGVIQPKWKDRIQQIDLFNELDRREAISFNTYEDLHNLKLQSPILANKKVVLKEIRQDANAEGLRVYNVV